MIRSIALRSLLLLAAGFACASAIASPDSVTVTLKDPDQFAELRQNRSYADVRKGYWLEQLRKYVVTRAGKRLAPGQSLDVVITDIKRAGDFEPWRGPSFTDVRIMKDIYPPKISLSYVLKDGNGATLRSADETLRDPAFLSRGANRFGDDSLRYEKRLIDDWLSRLLPRKA